MPYLSLIKRQSYGGVTTGISHAGSSVSSAAKDATSSLSRAEIIGVVVAILALTVLAVGLTWWCCVRSAKRRDAAREEEAARARERLQIAPTSGRVGVDMQEHPNAYDRLNERRGSERTIDEEWSREPLREAEYTGDGNGYVQEYSMPSGQQSNRYSAAPIQSPMREQQQHAFHHAQ